MILNLPQPKIPDIYSFGFDKNLNRPFEPLKDDRVEIIEDRLNNILQSGDTITNLVPGLQEVSL